MERTLADILAHRAVITGNKATQLAEVDRINDKAREDYNADYERCNKWVKYAGRRYAECEFDNFTINADPAIAKPQRAVVKRLVDYSQGRPVRNVLLIGPTGVGKDHLACALLRVFSRRLIECGYVSGPDLFARVASSWKEGSSDSSVHKDYTGFQVLCISDPALPEGLSDANVKFLYRLVDDRYRQCKATVITMNAEGGEDAKKKLGQQTWSRLRDGAIEMGCNWPDYRVEGGGK